MRDLLQRCSQKEEKIKNYMYFCKNIFQQTNFNNKIMKYKLLSTVFACAFAFYTNAQSQSFTEFSIGIDGGTYGFGAWGATNLSENFVLKVGFNYFGFGLPESNAKMDGHVQTTGERVRDMDVSFGRPLLRAPHGKLMVEWHPVADGIFSLAFGTYLGIFDFVADGLVADYQNAVVQHGGDIAFSTMGVNLQPRADGSFDGRLRMGNAVKPYFGIGLGRSIPKNRIGFKFDLGIAYQGRLKFISDQATIADIGDAIDAQEIPDGLGIMTTIANYARFWPVLNFSLSYKF